MAACNNKNRRMAGHHFLERRRPSYHWPPHKPPNHCHLPRGPGLSPEKWCTDPQEQNQNRRHGCQYGIVLLGTRVSTRLAGARSLCLCILVDRGPWELAEGDIAEWTGPGTRPVTPGVLSTLPTMGFQHLAHMCQS